MNSSTSQPDLDKTNFSGLRVLVTGGLGFIGSNVSLECARRGAEVTIYDNLDPNSGGNIHNIDGHEGSVCYHPGDIGDLDSIAEIIRDKDVVINCAASTSHPFSMEDPWLNSDVNSRGAINLLESVRRYNHGVKIVHIGTTTQLGSLRYRPADELHPEFPLDVYSANKMVSEKYVLLYANTYDLNATVLRLPNIYGCRAAIHSPAFTFVNFFIGRGLRGQSIPVFAPGNQLRNLLHVDDVVHAIAKSIISEGLGNQTFHVCGDEHLSVHKIAEIVADHFNVDLDLLTWPIERKKIDVGDAVFSSDKCRKISGWVPEKFLASALPDIQRFYELRLAQYFPKD